jgi:hypothetical protein
MCFHRIFHRTKKLQMLSSIKKKSVSEDIIFIFMKNNLILTILIFKGRIFTQKIRTRMIYFYSKSQLGSNNLLSFHLRLRHKI